MAFKNIQKDGKIGIECENIEFDNREIEKQSGELKANLT